ncbi:multidrug transporter subunit MdtD [Carnimonas nigrificans]|uniref:multidrug transporter subunit MdtD n=1 Tax=Carnimonas nigrificans TaxID=64323 RepID=UPI0004702929|nr:multidrug transporter subunit MdtD [Carnimonas nigrificans]
MAPANSSAQPITLSPRLAKLLPWLIASAFFMQGLDATIVNVALPQMALDLNQHPLRMQAVVIAYLLTVAALIPVSGWLSDRFGARRIFTLAIGLFTLGSLLCAMSPTLTLLVISRIMQGVGGALMVPVGRLIILRAYPRTQLVKVMSFVTMPALVGPLIGPTVGGWLVEVLSWHWIFLINLPVGIVGAIAAWRLVPSFQREHPKRFDTLGFLLFSFSMLAIALSLEGLSDLRLGITTVLLILVVGVASLTTYWVRAMKVDAPLFSPSLFAIRTFTVGILGNIFARLGNGALPFLVPLVLQVGLSLSPATAGMLMIGITLGAIAAKPLAQSILVRLGYKRTLVINTLLLGLLIMSLALLSTTTPHWLIMVHLFVLGVVNSLQFTAMNTLTLIDLQGDNAASGNSLLAVVMQMSIGMGVSSSAALLNVFTHHDAQQTLSAFAATFVCVGGIAMLAALIFLQLRPGDGRVKERKKRHA